MSELTLNSEFTLWGHDINSNNWDISGYNKIITISDINSFWKVFNNSSKLDFIKYNFFLMKNDIEPTWEHESNRYGGVFSLKCDNVLSATKIWNDLCVYLGCNIISNKLDDINGVSISVKNNLGVVKIWNNDTQNGLAKYLNKAILNNYPNVQMKYRANEPEY